MKATDEKWIELYDDEDDAVDWKTVKPIAIMLGTDRANLAGAAPDLYRALEAIVNDGILAHEPTLLDAANEALAKARGEA